MAVSNVPPISVVLAADRVRYIKGLTRFRDGNIEGWIEQFAIAAAQAARLAEAYLGAVTAQMGRWRALLAAGEAPRADAAAWAVIDALPAHPVITAPVAAAVTGRAKARFTGRSGNSRSRACFSPFHSRSGIGRGRPFWNFWSDSRPGDCR
jgi:hypothetical protein